MKAAANLTATTPTDREVVMIRVFDAPRNLVFDAMNKPELLKRWLLGPPGWSMTVCEVDLKVGGAFRHVWRRDDGTEMGMGGVYREITPPERIVRTEKFDDYPGESLCTLLLTEKAGRTTLTHTVIYPSKEARDATLASGMKEGVAASYDRLAGVLASPSVQAGRQA
jgi:uncharacterized protein YndB with AHSA1/START domain